MLTLVTRITSVHNHSTRSAAKADLNTVNPNLNYYTTRSCHFEGSKLLNDLGLAIQNATSVAVCRHRYIKDYYKE